MSPKRRAAAELAASGAKERGGEGCSVRKASKRAPRERGRSLQKSDDRKRKRACTPSSSRTPSQLRSPSASPQPRKRERERQRDEKPRSKSRNVKNEKGKEEKTKVDRAKVDKRKDKPKTEKARAEKAEKAKDEQNIVAGRKKNKARTPSPSSSSDTPSELKSSSSSVEQVEERRKDMKAKVRKKNSSPSPPPQRKERRRKDEDIEVVVVKTAKRGVQKTSGREKLSDPVVVGPERPVEFGPQLPTGPVLEKGTSIGPTKPGGDPGAKRPLQPAGGFRSVLPIGIHSNENYRGEADRNLALWLGRGKPAAGEERTGSPPRGPVARGKTGMSDRNFVFGRNRNARKR